MERVDVVSSNITGIGYDAGSEVLEVEFRTGTVYQYRDVPAEVNQLLMEAPSVGSFFSRHIKDEYECERVE
jgi:hypothetical protein